MTTTSPVLFTCCLSAGVRLAQVSRANYFFWEIIFLPAKMTSKTDNLKNPPVHLYFSLPFTYRNILVSSDSLFRWTRIVWRMCTLDSIALWSPKFNGSWFGFIPSSTSKMICLGGKMVSKMTYTHGQNSFLRLRSAMIAIDPFDFGFLMWNPKIGQSLSLQVLTRSYSYPGHTFFSSIVREGGGGGAENSVNHPLVEPCSPSQILFK